MLIEFKHAIAFNSAQLVCIFGLEMKEISKKFRKYSIFIEAN